MAFADGADEDAATRSTARAIASAGSGIPTTGPLALGQVMGVKAQPWLWLAACAQAADRQTQALLPIRVAYVARVWTDMIAPVQTPADVSDTGLLGAPPDVLAMILGLAIASALDVEQAQPIWPPDVDPGSMSVAEARRWFAARLLELDDNGVQVDPEVRSLAASFAA